MVRFVLFLCAILFCDCKEDGRDPKFFFGQRPQTVIAYRKVPEVVTEFIPSSCIVVEPTLPSCRHVRNLEIYPSVPTRITRTQTPQLPNAPQIEPQNWKPVPHPSGLNHQIPTPPLPGKPQQSKNPPPYWHWNFFNLFRTQNVTYTATKTEFITTTMPDPNTVVSFYVKGCRPSKLPFDLPECVQPEETKQKDTNILIMAPLKFVPGVDAAISPSKTGNATTVEEVQEKVTEGSQITAEGSNAQGNN